MRKPLLYTACLCCLAVSLNSVAQTNMPNTVPPSSLFNAHALLSFYPNLNITYTQPTISRLVFPQQAPGTKINPPSISDMPFFCAMECRLRERTRLWIKFRTGDDASYEKLIHSGEK